MKKTILYASLCLPLLACSGGSGGSNSKKSGSAEGSMVVLEVTDAPFDHAAVVEAVVRVDRVRVHVEDGQGDGEWLTFWEGQPAELDLLNLRNGVTRILAASELDRGEYRQFRIHVHSGYLELVNGDVFTTADNTLKLTSQATSGFKVFIDPPLVVDDATSYTLLLDFDLTKTFKPVPGNDALSASFFHLHPVIRGANLSETGELRGTVRMEDQVGQLVGVADATVYVMEQGQSQAVATTGTMPDGTWAVLGLRPGQYDVRATLGVFEGESLGHPVLVGSATEVDVVIE